MLNLSDNMGTLEWFPYPGEKAYALIAKLPHDEACLLDYYDTPEEAKASAQHFSMCVDLARLEGFTLRPGFFVHPAGYGVTIAEALVPWESPKLFQETLVRLKAGTYVPRGLYSKRLVPRRGK